MLLTIEGLTKRYPTGDLALKGVDLTIRRGDVRQTIPVTLAADDRE